MLKVLFDFEGLKSSNMEIDKSDILDDLQDIQDQVDGMGFRGTNANGLWRSELIADYIVKKLTVTNVKESLFCYIKGCGNIRDEDDCFCEEHLVE